MREDNLSQMAAALFMMLTPEQKDAILDFMKALSSEQV